MYDGLLKRTRSALHQRFAEWLETFSSEHRPRHGGPGDPRLPPRTGLPPAVRARSDGRRGDPCSGGAQPTGSHRPGLRAFVRGDMPAAANLLHRAAETLPDDEPTRPRLLARAGEARMETGAFREAIRLYDQAEEVAVSAGDRVAAGIAELGRLRLRYNTGDGVTDAQAREVDRLASRRCSLDAGDYRALAGCDRLLFNVELTHSQWTAAGHAAERMIEHARKAGDRLPGVSGSPDAGDRRDVWTDPRPGGDPALPRGPGPGRRRPVRPGLHRALPGASACLRRPIRRGARHVCCDPRTDSSSSAGTSTRRWSP